MQGCSLSIFFWSQGVVCFPRDWQAVFDVCLASGRIPRWGACLRLVRKPGSRAVSDSLDCEIAVKIRIRMEAYDHDVLDGAAVEIVETAKRTGAKVSGPVPLPTRIERYTVNRSPFVNKKSREQFEIRTHKRLIEILEPSARTMEDLRKINMPAGVNLKMKA